MKTTLAPHAVTARKLIHHEARRADRLYRGLLGHEIECLVERAQLMIDHNQDAISAAFKIDGTFRTLRRIIKSIRLMVIIYIRENSGASA